MKCDFVSAGILGAFRDMFQRMIYPHAQLPNTLGRTQNRVSDRSQFVVRLGPFMVI